MRTFNATLLALVISSLTLPGAARAEDAQPGLAQTVVSEAPPTEATDTAGATLWMRQAVATAGWPAGLISDTRAQVRLPLYRKPGSLLFNDTYAGLGMRLALTPAFVDVGPRLSLAPIDAFDVDVQGGWQGVWSGSSGMLPYEGLAPSTDSARAARQATAEGRARPSHLAYLSVAPTFKLKLGPVVAFSAWNVSFLRASQPDDVQAPYYYEAFRDLVVAWKDTTIEHQAALLYEVFDGESGPLLMVGATYRDRRALKSGDHSTNAGLLVVTRPFEGPAWPKFVVQVLPYLKSRDRVGGMPTVAVLAAWSGETDLKKLLR